MDVWQIVGTLLVLHMVDGRELIIAPAQITTMHEARSDDDPRRDLTKGIRCAIMLTDGKYVSVVEECHDIKQRIEEMGR